uniref:Uncharacterized protein n=1 Tax=Ciona intestinalis TaxID=7719 RepID=H2XNM0_CIOIN
MSGSIISLKYNLNVKIVFIAYTDSVANESSFSLQFSLKIEQILDGKVMLVHYAIRSSSINLVFVQIKKHPKPIHCGTYNQKQLLV